MLTIIIAGNFHQAREYAREHALPITEWRYADEDRDIFGIGEANIVYTGEFPSNPLFDSQLLRERESLWKLKKEQIETNKKRKLQKSF